MRLTALFLLTACLTASATATSQKVTLVEKDVPVVRIFQEIKKQTGYEFLYTDEMLEGTRPVTVELHNADISEALIICLKDQPLTFRIIEGTVVVKLKNISVYELVEQELPHDIHGRVTDSLGNPLAGASVTIKGAHKGVSTDADGQFELRGVEGNVTLLISFTGFTSREYKVNGKNAFTVELSRTTSPLDEIKVIAYGQTTQRLSTSDVTTVTSKAIEKQPVSNILLALEGRVPGLDIVPATGIPGTSVTVTIRGQNSIRSGNDPFYVIDGVPYPSALLPNLGGGIFSYTTGTNVSSGSPLSYLNPSDIESVSILKDADATAIYGSRAANGAILITTKKGKAGETTVDFNLQNGWGHVTRPLQMMNTKQYLAMRREAIKNDGLTVSSTDYDVNGVWDTTRYTDWQKVLIGNTAQYTHLTGTVSGGNANTQVLVSGTYHRETTVFPTPFADQKGSLHFSLSNNSKNQKFKTQLSGTYMIDANHLPEGDPSGTAEFTAPDAPPLYNPDGSLNWAPGPSGASTWSNPLASFQSLYFNKTGNLIANATFSYQLLPGLDLRSNFGYNNLQANERYVISLLSADPSIRNRIQSSAVFSSSNTNSYNIEPQVSYKHRFGIGSIEALAGSSIQRSNNSASQVTGTGYVSDQLLSNIGSAANLYTGPSTAFVYKYAAVFGRISYNLDDKYLLNLNARRDGSSRFGSANQFQTFGSVGIGWIFSKEGWAEKVLPFLSFGKLRASYGTTGDDQIGNYNYLSLYNTTFAQVPYQGFSGLAPGGLSNPYLQWELTKKAEAGLELGFLHDRILFNANYFRNRSSNELDYYTEPMITGFAGIEKNLPATVQNSGGEFTVSSVNIRIRNFSWSTQVNLTIPRNKLVAFPGLENTYDANTYIVGRSTSLRKTYHAIGVDKNTGIYIFATSKGGVTSTPSYPDDLISTVNVAPKYYGGIENTFSYKGLELSFLFQYKRQLGSNFKFGNYVPGASKANQPLSVLHHWQKPGDVSDIQRYNSDYSVITPFFNEGSSDAGVSDASFLRLKNVSLSWQLPAEARKRAHLQNARLFVQGQNLLTITKYIGNDPETQTTNTLPPVRVLTFGLQVTL